MMMMMMMMMIMMMMMMVMMMMMMMINIMNMMITKHDKHRLGEATRLHQCDGKAVRASENTSISYMDTLL